MQNSTIRERCWVGGVERDAQRETGKRKHKVDGIKLFVEELLRGIAGNKDQVSFRPDVVTCSRFEVAPVVTIFHGFEWPFEEGDEGTRKHPE